MDSIDEESPVVAGLSAIVKQIAARRGPPL
jgi:hypothetical protein